MRSCRRECPSSRSHISPRASAPERNRLETRRKTCHQCSSENDGAQARLARPLSLRTLPAILPRQPFAVVPHVSGNVAENVRLVTRPRPSGSTSASWGLAVCRADDYVSDMRLLCSKLLAVAVAGFALGLADIALAQTNIPSIMVDVDRNGVPIIAKHSRARPSARAKRLETRPETRPETLDRHETLDRQGERAERPRKIPRGSSAYVQPIPLPSSRASGIVPPRPSLLTTRRPSVIRASGSISLISLSRSTAVWATTRPTAMRISATI